VEGILACLALNRIAVNRMRGFASLRRAPRNISMKKIAAPQMHTNTSDPITQSQEQDKGQNWDD
jgi:hypothetical protein